MDATLRRDLERLQTQLELGSVQRAYVAIVSYMSSVRTHFARANGERAVSGLYQGHFDMTYFALFPPPLKKRGLKLAIVFDYEAYSFRNWLAARNRKIQRVYWEMLRNGGWSTGRLAEPVAGVDAVVECDVADALALANPGELTVLIEHAAVTLLGDQETFFSSHGADAT
jgi:hypothetical protein